MTYAFVRRRALARALARLTEDLDLTEKAARLGYWSRSAKTGQATWSRGMYELFGLHPGSFIPDRKAIAELIDPAERAALIKITQPPEPGAEGAECEARVRRADGTVRDTLFVVRYRYDKRGKLEGTFGVVIDISARKAAERATAEREAELQHAISATSASIWSIDLTTGTLEAGPEFLRMLGLDPETTTFSRALHTQLYHPADRERVPAAMDEHIATGAKFDVEYRLRHAAGHYVWIHSRGRRVTDTDGKPLRVIGTAVEITARRNAADELSRSRESLQLAMEASQAGHFIIDPAGATSEWSPRALEILGRTESNAPSAAILASAIHPDDLPEFLAEREEFWSRGRPLDVEVRAMHGAGHYIWIHIRAVMHADSDGPARAIGLIRDISQRKHSEKALADSEAKFRDLIEGSIQAILILDRVKPLFANRACAKLFGYATPEEMVGRGTFEPHIVPERRSSADARYQAAMAGEMDNVFQVREMLNRYGMRLQVELVGRRVIWDGKPAWQMTMLDITERTRIQDALRASEEQFRLLANNSSDVIIVFNAEGIITYASPSIEQLSGYPPRDVVGRTAQELVHPDDLAAVIQRRTDIVDGRRKPRDPVRWRLTHREGTLRWIETTSALLPAKDGAGADMVSTSRDITERVEREIELNAAHDRVETQANDLAMLAQNLENERERAEQGNAAKSQFLAMMSHELRTPMTGVIGMADLLQMTPLDEEQRDLTQLLTRSAHVLLDLLNDILDFSKIEAGQLQIEETPFLLSSVINDVKNLFVSSAAEKGISLSLSPPAYYRDHVVGDPKRLRQVLSNLVNNAIKFTETGEIHITFEEIESGPNLSLAFKITDTGIGIAKKDIERLFSPFIQADVSTSRRFGGTGLGLAICKRLVEAMNGTIGVESTPGKGSCFAFTVKLKRDLAAEANAPEKTQARADVIPSGASGRILLAEDNETSRYLITTMLTRQGHEVFAVENGALALDAVKTTEYDIVLMDMQMPVMDGAEATIAIRQLPAPRGVIPIIALTADVIADHRKMYLRAGVNAVVGKPVNWTELAREIARYFPGNGSLPGRKGKSKPPVVETVEAAVDDAALEGLAESLGYDILATMIDSFTSNMTQYRDDLEKAAAAGDVKQSKRVAHALKGLCAQFGAPRVTTLARAIEDQAKDMAQITPDVPKVRVAIEEALGAFAERKARFVEKAKSGERPA